MSIVLRVEDLKRTFVSRGVSYEALRGLGFTVQKGEFTGIMGPSGAGKTTLLNIIATIDKPTGGSVTIDGRDITKLKDRELADFRRENLGFLFQDSNLLDSLTLRENIALPLALGGAPTGTIDARVDTAADALGIGDVLAKHPYEVSGGQKQRAAAARALIHNPSMVLADEPTGALDSRSSADLLANLNRLNTDRGTTILMVTHDAFAASYCKRVLFIKDGNLYAELVRRDGRKDFFRQILDTLSVMGGGLAEVI